MKRPVESDYTSHVAYTRALEDYCDALEQQYMTNAAGELEPVTLVQTGVGIGKSEQEPVAWMLGDKFYKVKQCRLFSKNPGEEIPGQIPLYTIPCQRKEKS